MKRLTDIVFSLLGLLILSPLLVVLGIWIAADSKGGIFYRQTRVGKDDKDFTLLKFRSMYVGSDINGLITIGDNDARITSSGRFLRRYKLDELPQLINVLRGDMSLVGPRPEVRKYVDLYTEEQKQVLSVRPGITDPASIKYRNESELLANSDDPNEYYVNVIMQDKLKIYLEYVKNHSLQRDMQLIFQTLKVVITE